MAGAGAQSGRRAGAGKRGGVGANGSASERAQVSGERQLGVGAGGRQRLAGRERQGRGSERQARRLGAWAGYGLCTRCTWPVFDPVRLGIIPESIFWTLFVNPVHEHCSSQIFFFFRKKNILN